MVSVDQTSEFLLSRGPQEFNFFGIVREGSLRCESLKVYKEEEILMNDYHSLNHTKALSTHSANWNWSLATGRG
jgi:hypothetical protein